MSTPEEKLAAAVAALRKLQRGGRRVFPSRELSVVGRELLVRNGFVRRIMNGWWMLSDPTVRQDDHTRWYACAWEFCARYCESRFGSDWHLSAEQSLLMYAENTVIPSRVNVSSPKAVNSYLKLPGGTSLYGLLVKQMPPAADLTSRDGLRMYLPAAALVKVSKKIFDRYPLESRVALEIFRDAPDVLPRLLDGRHSVIAGQLAGALRRIGRPTLANEIVTTMRAAGHEVRERDPFAPGSAVGPLPVGEPPIARRLRTMWESMRGRVLGRFPSPPGLPQDKDAYLRSVDDIFGSDAHHSLSIEGYRVPPELIEQERAGNRDPDNPDADRQDRNALAARGYWQASQIVKGDIAEIIAGANSGSLIRNSNREWHRELFQPCVAAGSMEASALGGYRHNTVFLRTLRCAPPRWEVVCDAMATLFDLLENEQEPGVRAVLGHWLFRYIHPYPDGNGWMARFLMNAMLASGGYPWTVIRAEDRAPYLTALESASIDLDIAPFANFIAKRVRWSMERGTT